MDSSPIFREVRLVINNEQDVQFAVQILLGKTTVSQVAELKGQESYCFDGDADILVLSYSTDPTDLCQKRARDLIGDTGDWVVQKKLIAALVQSTVALELGFQYCNLSTETVIKLADAIRENRSLVGFNISGNPGNDEIGKVSLKHACIETRAPIKWFQGKFLPEYLVEARQDMARKCALDALQNDAMSPKSKVAELRKIQLMAPDSGVEVLELHSRLHPSTTPFHAKTFAAKKEISKVNEREQWLSEMRSKLTENYKTEKEVDAALANLELHELQLKIERLLFESPKKGLSSITLKRTSFPQMV